MLVHIYTSPTLGAPNVALSPQEGAHLKEMEHVRHAIEVPVTIEQVANSSREPGVNQNGCGLLI